MSHPNQSARRTCLLTGAGGRLGSAVCAALAVDYDIVAVYRNRHPDAASQLQWWIDPLRPEVLPPPSRHPVFAVHSDLSSAGEVERLVDLALAKFGRIDVLVNAAVRYHFGTLISEQSLSDAVEQFELNTLLPVRLAGRVAQEYWQHVPDENRQNNRNVVNVSSISATETYPGGQGMYSAAKAALNTLTRHMALDYAPLGVRVNALAPTSFPGLVPTSAVLDGLRSLDSGDLNGRILTVDVDGTRAL